MRRRDELSDEYSDEDLAWARERLSQRLPPSPARMVQLAAGLESMQEDEERWFEDPANLKTREYLHALRAELSKGPARQTLPFRPCVRTFVAAAAAVVAFAALVGPWWNTSPKVDVEIGPYTIRGLVDEKVIVKITSTRAGFATVVVVDEQGKSLKVYPRRDATNHDKPLQLSCVDDKREKSWQVSEVLDTPIGETQTLVFVTPDDSTGVLFDFVRNLTSGESTSGRQFSKDLQEGIRSHLRSQGAAWCITERIPLKSKAESAHGDLP